MKTAPVIALAGGAMLVLVLGWLFRCHSRAPSGPLVHVRNQFDFTVHAPYRVAAPLFGPEGERVWAAGWDPHFLYPQPAQDIQGAVFTVRHGHHQAYWINTSFDKDARHFQYVYLIPDVMVVLIDVRFSELDPGNTMVNVVYERTALNPEANEHVRESGDSDRESGKEWGTAINDYLAERKAAGD
jgi:hypothetical protein